MRVTATYIGGPTVLIEISGVRFLTDPTFDPAGSSYETPVYTLHKTIDPALTPDALEPIDTILLSHDHHFDNLDRSGRAMLPRARRVLVPPEGAKRVGGASMSITPWESIESNGQLEVTGTPARHGPAGGDRGPVTGFLITEGRSPAVYISGDTVWYEGVEVVARRADVRVAFAFMGAARVREVGSAHLTLTAAEGVLLARAMPNAVIVPLHYEGWAHFSEGRPEIERAFASAALSERLRWLPPGQPVAVYP
ncbi:MAG TPA: MBL fold metallo-hydrolase [Gemmatimonadaceae bacterium]|nr:MBL fold metallo-hydrolase [Gemmatimonadaceae bacterium]